MKTMRSTSWLKRARAAGTVSILALVALVAVCGVLGLRAYESHREQADAEQFLVVGRQAALHLTSVDYTEVDRDVHRILDFTTGAFHQEFQRQSQQFVDMVKHAQSQAVGEITAAGLESVEERHAQVLVAVTVRTLSPALAEEQPQMWRMRIEMQKVGDDVKVSNVEFVP